MSALRLLALALIIALGAALGVLAATAQTDSPEALLTCPSVVFVGADVDGESVTMDPHQEARP